MRNRELVWRPDREPQRGDGAGATDGLARDDGAVDEWRRFVLDQVGYDEVARERAARRAMRAMALRRFLRGLGSGLLLFAIAFGVILVALSWREGRFDGYLPQPGEVADVPAPHREREVLPVETRHRDAHVELANPLTPPMRVAPPVDDGGDDPAPTSSEPAQGSD